MTKLQVYRKLNNLTQLEFSRLSNTSVRSIQDLEQGRVDINSVHLSTLVRFGKVLNVPFVVLLDDVELEEEIRRQCEAVRKREPGPAQQ